MKTGVRAIARISGVSVATVSRVLNGSSKVSEKTRKLVEDAMRELNYTPDAAARALATKRSRIVGAVIPTIEHSIFATFIRRLEEVLADSGYALVIAITDNRQELERARARDLLRLGVEALILSGLDHDNEMIAQLEHQSIPIVCTSIHDYDPAHPTIGYRNDELAASAAAYLHELGHERIGVIHGPAGNNDRTRLRIEGVRHIFPEADQLVLQETSLSVPGGTAAASALLSTPNPPSAIFCLSDVLALGTLFEASRRGINVPDQLSVMGFDNLEWADQAHPRLTTIALPVEEMGFHAARAIIERLENGTAIESLELEGRILKRETTAPYRP